MIAVLLLIASAAPGECAGAVRIEAGLPVALETVDPLSSKTHVKGDMIALRTASDVQLGETMAIPRGTPVTGQIADARPTGGLGQNGMLAIRPLYLRLGGTVVRLVGASEKRTKVPAGTVVGLVLVTPVISGGNARVPAGTAIDAEVEKAATLCLPQGQSLTQPD